MKYSFKARTREGKIETGAIDAHSKEDAVLLLQKYNIFTTSLQEQITKESFFKNIKFEKKISRKDLAILFRQLAVMLESRVPVVQSLASLASQTNKKNFKKVILDVSNLVEEGVPLSEALSNYPKVFDIFYINLIKSGEVSGNISGSLHYISEHLEKESDIISQLRQAMIYPIFVFSVLFIVIGIIIVQVVPRISDLVRETNSKPSPFTQIMLSFYDFLENYWWIIAVIIFFFIVSIVLYFRTKEGEKNLNRLSLKVPFLSLILKKVFIARFCGNISTLLSAGISINKALQITEDTINNIVYKEIIAKIGKKVSEGEKIRSIMAEYPYYFPPFVIQMIKVGEETGKLDKSLIEVVSFYEKDIKRAIDLFTGLLEPIMIIILGIIVGILAISVFAPLYETLGNI